MKTLFLALHQGYFGRVRFKVFETRAECDIWISKKPKRRMLIGVGLTGLTVATELFQ